MKYLAIVKHHPCEQLAHLYKHLFVTTVYHHRQYNLLGYAPNGTTYDSGVISASGGKPNIKLPLIYII